MAILLKTTSVRVSSIQIMQTRVQNKAKEFEAEVAYRQQTYEGVLKDLEADTKVGKEGIASINSLAKKYGGENGESLVAAGALALSGMSKEVATQFMGFMHNLAKAAGDPMFVAGNPPNTSDLPAKTVLFGDMFKKK